MNINIYFIINNKAKLHVFPKHKQNKMKQSKKTWNYNSKQQILINNNKNKANLFTKLKLFPHKLFKKKFNKKLTLKTSLIEKKKHLYIFIKNWVI